MSMRLPRLWWTGVSRPTRAFEEIKLKPAPLWGFWVVMVFNIMISITTLLALYLLGRPPLMKSALTFLPTEDYLLPEMFFLPLLRILVWLMGSAVIHLGLRLLKETSDFDQILNIGGMGYLVIMPVILLSDWVLVLLNAYRWAQFSHSIALPWSIVLTAVGLRSLLGIRFRRAVLLGIIGEMVSIPFLALLAR